MSITGIGILIVLAVAIGLMRGALGMLSLLILSSPLQAAVVLTFGLLCRGHLHLAEAEGCTETRSRLDLAGLVLLRLWRLYSGCSSKA
jgi:hypothetical protein